MDYSRILEELARASLFDLYRLQIAIGHQLDDPRRIQEIKRQLKPGQEIAYFDDQANKLVQAQVVSLKRTRLLVENRDDHQRWSVPFCSVNLAGVDTDIRSPANQHGLDKSQLKIGDQVGFRDRKNNELYGQVIRLNRKTATVLVGDASKWRVAYSLLFPILDGERAVDQNLIEGQVVGNCDKARVKE
jgi:transcription termination factor Rho